VLGEHPGEHAVHPTDRIAHGHRPERVAVVAAPDREQPRAPVLPLRALELQAELDRDLDRDRARVGEEDRVERIRRELEQEPRQAHPRLVRQPAEHDMRHSPELTPHGLVQSGVPVAVDRAPPGGHPVDQLTAVGQLQAHPLRRDDRERVDRARQRPVRMPDMLAVEREQLLPVGHRLFVERRPRTFAGRARQGRRERSVLCT